jgi:hypothetical protein
MHLYSIFEPYCGTAPKVYTRPTGKVYIRFTTLSSPKLTEFHDLFYSNGVKTVPPTIGDILTARSLAYLLVEDGAKMSAGFVLCTNAFTYEACQLLCSVRQL